MSDRSDLKQIAEADWIEWLVAFNDLSRGFIEKAAIDPPYGDDPRRQSAMLAIAARAFTLFRSALTLLQQGELLGFRILVRGIVECAMHMEAACFRPEYLQILLDDDKASRVSRGKAFQKIAPNLTEDSNRRLQQFVMGDGTKPQSLNLGDFSKGSDFPRYHHIYREISADAEHVTWTSLCRHPQELADRVHLEIDPQLTDFEMFDTVSIMALAGMTCVKHLRESLGITQNEAEFSALGHRYIELYRCGIEELRRAEEES
ncbi:DUF5677 domain-containing protein [Rhizobium ruizarguesonis]|jgi:hypothetical protein|uniref:DUF5677 domain-containing protein n=1 Tax=Rhizobium ruizarguesonis TaxID=2081791 RepID=UPI0013DE8E83|nr:DUF5677 domain-containing protein [Rhizobium ruizarguesonis]NEJ97343.1 hypothetical protein [Rhizobium ruizarguesonis]